jgi:hypothetical protein
MQATRLLKQGCSGFLVCVTKEAPKAMLEEIPIVRDFVDVFPEELPGLPPDREIEFTIDLLPGTGTYIQGTLSDGTTQTERVERAVTRTPRQRIHSPKCISLGSARFICEEKGRIDEVVYRL